jgi:hypothetical protein
MMKYRIKIDWSECPLSDSAIPPLWDRGYDTYEDAIRKGIYKACKRHLKHPFSDPWLDAAACGVVVAAVNGCDSIADGALDEWLRILAVKIVKEEAQG